MTPRPKSTKSKFHIALDPDVMKGLKLLSVEYDHPVGDVIKALLALFHLSPENEKFLSILLENADFNEGASTPCGNLTCQTVIQIVRDRKNRERRLEELEGDE